MAKPGGKTSIRFECPDAKKLAASLGRAADEIEDMQQTYWKAATTVATRAKVLAPVESGALARSINPTKEGSTAVITAGGGGVEYAGPIHWGWPKRNIEAQPFMVKALDQVSGDIRQAYFEGVEKVVDRIDTK